MLNYLSLNLPVKPTIKHLKIDTDTHVHIHVHNLYPATNIYVAKQTFFLFQKALVINMFKCSEI